MEKQETYSFTDEEIEVLANALAMYASYHEVVVSRSLVADESDFEKIMSRGNTAKSMAWYFVEEDEGERREALSAHYQLTHGRPMDLSDVSPIDWYETDLR